MIFAALLITFLLGLLLVALPICMVDDLDTEWIKVVVIVFMSSLTIALGTGGVYGIGYVTSGETVAELKAKYNNNLNNLKTIALSLNKHVIVVTQNENLLIDVANWGQSTVTSKAFTDYVEQVNQYNIELALAQVRRTPGFFFKTWYGWQMPLPEELKTVTIKF